MHGRGTIRFLLEDQSWITPGSAPTALATTARAREQRLQIWMAARGRLEQHDRAGGPGASSRVVHSPEFAPTSKTVAPAEAAGTAAFTSSPDPAGARAVGEQDI